MMTPRSFSTDATHSWKILPTLTDPKNGFPRNARAVVVLIGWWGAKPRHLKKYAELYRQSISPSLAVVLGTASPKAILMKDDVKLRQFAKDGLDVIANVVDDYENLQLPVLVHIFSNGGAFVWQHMVDIMMEQEQAQQYPLNTHNRNVSLTSMDTEETPLHTNTAVSLLRKNIKGLIMDSAPAYPRLDNGIAALDAGMGESAAGGSILRRILLWVFKCFFVIAYVMEACWDRLCGRPHRLLHFWNELIQCNWTSVPQGFIFSTVDKMCDATHLQDFVNARTERLGKDMVSVLRFNDSPHVQHYKSYPDQYRTFVDDFVQQHLIKIRRQGAVPRRPSQDFHRRGHH